MPRPILRLECRSLYLSPRGLPQDKVADIVFTIKKFAAEQEWGEIVTIDGGGRPMVSIVYDRYYRARYPI
jgi:hypothetical protein